MSKPISRYPVPEFDSLPQDIKETILPFKEELGFIPNVLLVLAHRPDEFRAFMAYLDALMNKESGLTAAEKEMVIVVHSSYNNCPYCVQSHGAALRVAAENPYISDQIVLNYHKADVTPREKAILDFAMKVNSNSDTINQDDFETLKSHGLNEEDIWDIAGITAFFNLSNRMMNFTGARPDDEFYTLGRL